MALGIGMVLATVFALALDVFLPLGKRPSADPLASPPEVQWRKR